MVNLSPFPVLTTNNLILRKLADEDEREIFALRSDVEIAKYLDRPLAVTIDDARQFIAKINQGISDDEMYYWAVMLKETPKLIGTVCLFNIIHEHNKTEIGYELFPGYQGKGFMQEAVSAVIKYAFEIVGFNSIEAVVTPDNVKSIKLLKRNNFKFIKDNPPTVVYELTN